MALDKGAHFGAALDGQPPALLQLVEDRGEREDGVSGDPCLG
jgi:hypothetical protein